MAISESKITLDFPDNNHFRFEDCQGYKQIQEHLKEMDACWFDQNKDILYLIELKNWGTGKLEEENDSNYPPDKLESHKEGINRHRVNTLVKKSIDSVSMILSIVLEKPYATKIQACAPFAVTNNTQLKLLTIINWDNPDATYIASIHAEYKSKFKPYATLFAIPTFVVMTKTMAMQQFDWVQ